MAKRLPPTTNDCHGGQGRKTASANTGRATNIIANDFMMLEWQQFNDTLRIGRCI
jgi:hypothetical protein